MRVLRVSAHFPTFFLLLRKKIKNNKNSVIFTNIIIVRKKSGLLTTFLPAKNICGVFMGRRKKITWDVIYDDFKKEYPKLKPYDYATILIFFLDRVRMTYNYDTKEVTKLEGGTY